MKVNSVLTVRAAEFPLLERTAKRLTEWGHEVEVRLGVYDNAVLITNALPRTLHKAKTADNETKLLGMWEPGKKISYASK
jgi:hypothetical protein